MRLWRRAYQLPLFKACFSFFSTALAFDWILVFVSFPVVIPGSRTPCFFSPTWFQGPVFFERCRIILPQQYHHAVSASQSWFSYHIEAKTRSYTWHQSVWNGWKQIPWNTLSLPRRRRHLSGFLQVFEEMKVLMLRLLDAHEVEMKHLLCFSQVGPASRVDKLLDAQNQPGNFL